MTIEQKKIALIHWITNLQDETVLNQLEGFRQTSLSELPEEIADLLAMSMAEPDADGVEHTSVQDILNRPEA
ncbi:hypothetical protein [Marinoscillum sp.]|uniref:hypothetical protein n=1 Tax=Marinoscillum sp. TaxID=2024838 RepID=UPI003BABF270